jgi:cytoskeletal protein CcmA (bactofilin family)
MWKRDEAVKPGGPAGSGPSQTTPVSTPPAATESIRTTSAPSEPLRGMEKTTVNIGKSVVIKGELNGSEDLTIEGQVDGKIELRQNVLTIGPNGKIKAQVVAKTVVVEGQVQGNVTATERIDIRDKGSVEGDLSAPRVAIADGAHFRGSIDMQQAKAGDKAHDAKPSAAASTPSAQPSAPQPQQAPASSPATPAAAGAAR